jgi:hypothetical protein
VSIQSNLMVLSESILASSVNQDVLKLYGMLNDHDLSFAAFQKGIQGLRNMCEKHILKNDSLITIIDFSKPSNEERFFVIDIKNVTILYKSLVAHGKNSGDVYATSFSNQMSSLKSSIGLFKTDHVYYGSNGYSLMIDGMEKGLNDMAKVRSIVIHGANYVSSEYIKKYGRLGRSFGCPALPTAISTKVIDLIKDGSCMYLYYPSGAASSQLAMN